MENRDQAILAVLTEKLGVVSQIEYNAEGFVSDLYLMPGRCFNGITWKRQKRGQVDRTGQAMCAGLLTSPLSCQICTAPSMLAEARQVPSGDQTTSRTVSR